MLARLSSFSCVSEELDSGFGLVLRTGSKLLAVPDLIDEAELGMEEPE